MLCPYVDTAWTNDEAGHIQSRRRVFPRNTGAVHGASGATAWSCVVNNAAIYNGSGPCSGAMCTAVCAKLARTSWGSCRRVEEQRVAQRSKMEPLESSKVQRFTGSKARFVAALVPTAGTVWDHRCWLRIAPSDGPVPPRHWLSLTVS